jgi:hypothetical protein
MYISKRDNPIRKRYRQKKREKGLCPACGRKPDPPFIYCEYHRKKRREAAYKYINKKIKENRCRRCGVPLHPEMDKGYKHCMTHRESVEKRKGVYRSDTRPRRQL